MSQTATAQRWTALVDQHEASGLTLKAFAAEHGVNVNTLAGWRARLGRSKARGPREHVTPSPFVELRVAPPPADDALDHTVVLALEGFGAHVVVDRQTDLGLLKQLLEALC